MSLVINYDLPNSRELYIHRIGRSGRFGRKVGSKGAPCWFGGPGHVVPIAPASKHIWVGPRALRSCHCIMSVLASSMALMCGMFSLQPQGVAISFVKNGDIKML